MNTIYHQYITDKDGTIVSVVIPLAEYEQIFEELDELDDIVLFDEAKAENEQPLSFDEYVRLRRGK